MRDFQKEIGDPFLDPENIAYYFEEMADKTRHPKKRSKEVWGHLKKFWSQTP